MDTVLSFVRAVTSSDWGAYLAAATAVVTAATAITALTPSQTDDRVVQRVLDVLNFLAGNFGKNKNADDA